MELNVDLRPYTGPIIKAAPSLFDPMTADSPASWNFALLNRFNEDLYSGPLPIRWYEWFENNSK